MSDEKVENEEVTEEEVVLTPDEVIAELRGEIESHKNKHLLTLAEMENARKRLQKEKHDMTRFAVENVIGDFLMPLDNLENALGFADTAGEETKNWAMGFKMIVTQFKDILQGHNIKPFHAEGLFDPHLHEAIETEETEKHAEGTILEEFAVGYKSGDRVIRAARVKVAKAPQKDQETNNEEDSE